MKYYIRALRAPFIIISAAIAAIFAAAALAQAATTIGTDISTMGSVGIGTTTPASPLDVWGSLGDIDNNWNTYLPGGAATLTYGKDMGTQTFGMEDYTLDKPILTLKTPNGMVAPDNDGGRIDTALLIQAQPLFGGQGVGTAIVFGGGNTDDNNYSNARIVYFDDIANSAGGKLQLQARNSGLWNPGLELWDDGSATYGYPNGDREFGDGSELGLFSIFATSTGHVGGPVATAFSIFGTNGTTKLFQVGNNGNVGIGATPSSAVSLQVATSTTNATTTVVIGKSGQNKGSCLVMYDDTGAVQYVSIQGGSLVVSGTSCQ